MTEHKQPESNGLAIASLVLGILSMTGFSIFTGIPAIITGAIGLKNPTNKGMSLAGLIMGSVSVVLTVLFLIFIMFLILAGAFTQSPSDTPNNSDYYNAPNTRTNQRI
jgi:hypothetical protein